MIDISKPIILIGFKHAGKTVLGAALAQRLQVPFIDLDQVIESHYHETLGTPLTSRKIAQKHGIEYFRDLESMMLGKVLSKNPKILALGGGTPLKAENQRLISQGTVILVKAPKGSVFERIMVQGRPAFFPEGEDAFDAFTRIWAEREPIYHQLATHQVMNTGSINEGVENILSYLTTEVIT